MVILSDFAVVNGGAAQVAVASAGELAARGHRVIFVAGCGPTVAALQVPGIEVRLLGLTDVRGRGDHAAAALDAVWNRRAAAGLGIVLAGLDPAATVVHAHQWTRMLSPSVLGTVLDRGFPLAITLHDYFACCPNGLFFNFGQGVDCGQRPLSAGCALAACDRDGVAHKLVRLLRQLMMSRQLRRGRLTFIHVSEFARARAAPFLPADAVHAVVPNPCLVPRRAPAMPECRDGFAFIGRFTEEKGTAVLAQVAAAGRHRLTAMGDGPLRQQLEKASPLVTVLPWGTPAAVLELLDRSRALLFPSLWAETQGLVACEAMARGVPVVASAGTGAADLVQRTGGGIVVPPGDRLALTEAMDRLSEPGCAARLGVKAYAGYWAAPMTTERHIDALRRIYAKAVSTRGPESAAERSRVPAPSPSVKMPAM